MSNDKNSAFCSCVRMLTRAASIPRFRPFEINAPDSAPTVAGGCTQATAEATLAEFDSSPTRGAFADDSPHSPRETADNAAMESFFASLKKELVHHEDYAAKASLSE